MSPAGRWWSIFQKLLHDSSPLLKATGGGRKVQQWGRKVRGNTGTGCMRLPYCPSKTLSGTSSSYTQGLGDCAQLWTFSQTCLAQSRHSNSCLSNETHFIEAANFQAGKDCNESPNSTFLFYIWGTWPSKGGNHFPQVIEKVSKQQNRNKKPDLQIPGRVLIYYIVLTPLPQHFADWNPKRK